MGSYFGDQGVEGDPDNLRVSYVLPSNAFQIMDSGVFWPSPNSPDLGLVDPQTSSDYQLVWVDIE